MKSSIDLVSASKKEWVEAVLNDFDAFLQDHANCERKASAMAMSMVAKYPDRVEIIPDLIDTAVEELEHFRDVYKWMEKRGVQLLQKMEEDDYVKKLINLCRSSREERFMDRLLVASVVECRGAERFHQVWQALEPGELKQFYHQLWASEAKHGHIFVNFALIYFNSEEVYNRLHFFNEHEARIIDELPIKAALH